MKGKPRDSKTFETFREAMAFMKALQVNPDCESVTIQRN
jgi:hypothetical protein